MTTGNADTDNAEACPALPWADAVPIAPHILIAEDQPAIRELLCWALQLAGYRTAVCVGRHAALAWRDQAIPHADLPVLLLLDVSLLSTKEAADFLRHVRARWQDAGGVLPQIIVLTTNTQMQEDLVPREHVLQKPFHIRDLIALIQQVIPVASSAEDNSSREAHVPDHRGGRRFLSRGVTVGHGSETESGSIRGNETCAL